MRLFINILKIQPQRINLIFLLLVASVFFLCSCEKEAGPGGSSSIKGYVHVTDYDNNLLVILGEYPGFDEWVYLRYGDDISYSDRIRSGPDGTFEFKYLRKGKYKLYVYSKDTCMAGQIAVSKDVEISRNKQTVDAGTFNIKD